MKKRYAIYFEGVFEIGYVKASLLKKSKSIKINTIDESKKIATKFNSKFIANLFCKMCNWISETNCDLRTYKVVEL